LWQGLRELGYIEGQNLVMEYRWAGGDYERLPRLAQELVGLKPDLIFSAGGPPAARAAKAATGTIPVVFVSGNAVEAGVVSSLARPGGNLTGFDVFAEELDIKRLEILKEALPKVVRVAVLWNPGRIEGRVARDRLESAAQAVGMKLSFVEARQPDQIETAFAAIARDRADAMLLAADPMFVGEAARFIRLAAAARRPAIYPVRIFAEGGGLMSYGADFAAIYRRAATYVDRILNGAKPGELPVEQPTKYELVINLKTASALGLMIPPSVRLRADRVIE
jgi:putative ABC transport system substrate-binding protein